MFKLDNIIQNFRFERKLEELCLEKRELQEKNYRLIQSYKEKIKKQILEGNSDMKGIVTDSFLNITNVSAFSSELANQREIYGEDFQSKVSKLISKENNQSDIMR